MFVSLGGSSVTPLGVLFFVILMVGAVLYILFEFGSWGSDNWKASKGSGPLWKRRIPHDDESDE